MNFHGIEWSRQPDGTVLLRAERTATAYTLEELARAFASVSDRAKGTKDAQNDAVNDAYMVLTIGPERELGLTDITLPETR